MILFWLACTSSPLLSQGEGSPFHSDHPVIESVSFGCDAEEAEWNFGVKTTHWTGGGHVWMVKTSEITEKHRIASRKAAADGSSDELELKLSIEPDWRDAKADRSSRWLCSDTPDLTVLLTVFGPSGQVVRDCRTWGADPSIWSTIEDAFDCTERIEFPTEEDDTGESGDTGGSEDTGDSEDTGESEAAP